MKIVLDIPSGEFGRQASGGYFAKGSRDQAIEVKIDNTRWLELPYIMVCPGAMNGGGWLKGSADC